MKVLRSKARSYFSRDSVTDTQLTIAPAENALSVGGVAEPIDWRVIREFLYLASGGEVPYPSGPITLAKRTSRATEDPPTIVAY